MLVSEATKKICPAGSGLYATPETRKRVGLPHGASQFCAGDACMAWCWMPGDETEMETRVVWYLDHLYPLPTVTENDATRSDEDRELIAMLLNCHQQIRDNIVLGWSPTRPEGDGWTLKEKRWDSGLDRPMAVFWRPNKARHGCCGFVGLVRNWAADQG